MKILLIEDNLLIGQQIIDMLEAHQWSVDYANTGHQGLTLSMQEAYDLVLLDLNLPDKDGVDICREIKSHSAFNVPILMVTARDHFDDKAKGYLAGADDYLTKPFDLRELVLRCKALSRRNQLHQNKVIEIADLKIDLTNHQVSRQNVPIQMTNVGFKILVLLAQNFPNPVTRNALLHHIWGDDLPDSNALKSHIYSLRNAVDKPFAHPMLKTITNVGYQLVEGHE